MWGMVSGHQAPHPPKGTIPNATSRRNHDVFRDGIFVVKERRTVRALSSRSGSDWSVCCYGTTWGISKPGGIVKSVPGIRGQRTWCVEGFRVESVLRSSQPLAKGNILRSCSHGDEASFHLGAFWVPAGAPPRECGLHSLPGATGW